MGWTQRGEADVVLSGIEGACVFKQLLVCGVCVEWAGGELMVHQRPLYNYQGSTLSMHELGPLGSHR